MRLAAGTRFGPYEIRSALGAGGMGEVYCARDIKLNRDVAIKVLPDLFANDPERRARFRREAQVLAALNHPSIAHIHGFEDSEGIHALVMELVDGPTLAERIAQGPIPLIEALPIAKQIAEAIEAAHEQGIIHRDLKPANIKVREDGTVKVLDFGLAKLATPETNGADARALAESPTVTSPAATRAGVVLGTAAYMSPEQARGRPMDTRTDIWAFGCVLYETLTGRVAFAGDTVSDTIAAILERAPDWQALPASTPASVRHLLAQCLEKDSKRRLRDIGQARLELDDAMDARRASGRSDHAARRAGAWLVAPAATAMAVGIGLYTAHSLLTRNRGPALNQLSFTQLTEQPGQEIYPSLSPDGRSLVYASQASGNWDLYLQRVGGKTAINLTKDSPAEDTQPSFSPDGEQIAFRSEREGGGLFVMGATGESVKRLTDGGYHPAWSPDGKEIAFATVSFVNPLNLGSRAGQLFVLDVTTGERRLIVQPEHVYQPHWSPHGHRIAYWSLSADSGSRDLWSVASAGGDPVRVTNDAATDWNPVWSPDGRYLYFSSDRGGSMNIWKVAVEETSGKVLGSAEPVTTPSPYSGYLSLSRVGGRMAYSQVTSSENIFKIVFDPSSETAIGPSTAITQGSRLNTEPDLSPDGQWVTFVVFGTQEDVFLVRTDGTRTRQLTADRFKDRSPRWSPDGTQIAFHSDRSGKYEVWTVNPDGSGLRQVTDLPRISVTTPVWSPDGARIAFRTDEQGQIPGRLFVTQVGKPRQGQTPQAVFSSQPEGSIVVPSSWSVDGRRIAVGLFGSAGILIYDFDSHELTRLTEFGTNPRWLSDGRRLLFRHQNKLYLVDSQSRNVHEVLSASPNTIENLSLSADDRLLIYTIRIREADIWLAGPER